MAPEKFPYTNILAGEEDSRILRTPSPYTAPSDIIRGDYRNMIARIVEGCQNGWVGGCPQNYQFGHHPRLSITRETIDAHIVEHASPTIIFNPKIIDSSGELEWLDGCGSIFVHRRDTNTDVPLGVRHKRPKTLVVSGFDENGEFKKWILSGMSAFIAEHEFQHLDGKLIVDIAVKIFVEQFNSFLEGKRRSLPLAFVLERQPEGHYELEFAHEWAFNNPDKDKIPVNDENFVLFNCPLIDPREPRRKMVDLVDKVFVPNRREGLIPIKASHSIKTMEIGNSLGIFNLHKPS